jgi:alpha/beta superfamily hydrolase
LSAFGTGKWKGRVEKLVQDESRRTLLVHGTEDQFTKHTVRLAVREAKDPGTIVDLTSAFSPPQNYESWRGRLAAMSGKDRLHVVTIEGADHFWRTREHLGGLIEAIRTWAKAVT